MTHIRFSWLSRVALLVLLLLPSLRVSGKIPEMTQEQARQSLLQDLQAPDTALIAVPAVDFYGDGHTHYSFHGNAGTPEGKIGSYYDIDAATGEKEIGYVGFNDDGCISDHPLTSAQLQQIATRFVAAHFPHYATANLRSDAPAVDVELDLNEYDISFTAQATSGAYLPIKCHVDLKEDTGQIIGYAETAIPVTISTIPALTQEQAVQCGRDWIAQNISADPAAGEFMTDNGTGEPSIDFRVAVDPTLNQALVYEIEFTPAVLTIDAQTGAVLSTDGYIGMGKPLHSGPRLPPQERQSLLTVMLNIKGQNSADLNHAAIWTQDQTYLWQGQVKLLGIAIISTPHGVVLSRGAARVRLAVQKQAVPNNRTAWRRGKDLYIPLDAVKQLTSTVHKQNSGDDVVLTL